jgi:hypothetical protein
MSDPRLWPLAAWCDRSPRIRWPLLVVVLFLLWGIAGGIDTEL